MFNSVAPCTGRGGAFEPAAGGKNPSSSSSVPPRKEPPYLESKFLRPPCVQDSRILSLKELAIKFYLNHGLLVEPDPKREPKVGEIIEKQWRILQENAPRGPIDIPKIMCAIERNLQHFSGSENRKACFLFHHLQKRLEVPFKQAGIDRIYEARVAPAEFISLQSQTVS